MNKHKNMGCEAEIMMRAAMHEKIDFERFKKGSNVTNEYYPKMQGIILSVSRKNSNSNFRPERPMSRN
jgi:hypothetical protein